MIMQDIIKSVHKILVLVLPEALEAEILARITIKVRKKAKIRNRYNRETHLSKDTTWESDKNTRKHHTQESQEVSTFPAGDHKAATNRKDIMTDRKHKGQKLSTKEAPLGTVSIFVN